MKKTIKWLGNFMIMTSIFLLVWLIAGNMNSKQQQNHLLDAFDSVKAEADFDRTITTDEQGHSIGAKQESQGIEGILSIPVIDLESPVLYGADPVSLSKALGAVADMDEPGELDGSYAIAGHQAHVFGAFFNRLHEVEVGTRFIYETVEESMEFEVFDVKVVKPNEVDVLDRKKGVALLSLITCYPANSNKYRLVVQAKRVEAATP
ncbi:class D sortase [Sporosarcina sp. FSL K6-1508]|uniref:class D sortase n=1 Tax=Sporosarcina sp. FSL K6-1508 TaxID=2921553 RepID=UPI0030FBD1A0